MAKVLMIIAQKDFRDDELIEPKSEIEKAGHRVVIGSSEKGKCAGMLGGTTEADISLSEANASEYGAVVFVGGMGAQAFFNDARALSLAREAYEKGKVVAAICIAPVILANAELLSGKRASVSRGCVADIERAGAKYIGAGVAFDGKIITADGPKNEREFGRKIAELLSIEWNVLFHKPAAIQEIRFCF